MEPTVFPSEKEAKPKHTSRVPSIASWTEHVSASSFEREKVTHRATKDVFQKHAFALAGCPKRPAVRHRRSLSPNVSLIDQVSSFHGKRSGRPLVICWVAVQSLVVPLTCWGFLGRTPLSFYRDLEKGANDPLPCFLAWLKKTSFTLCRRGCCNVSVHQTLLFNAPASHLDHEKMNIRFQGGISMTTTPGGGLPASSANGPCKNFLAKRQAVRHKGIPKIFGSFPNRASHGRQRESLAKSFTNHIGAR